MICCGVVTRGFALVLFYHISFFLVYFAVRPAEKRKQPRTENVFDTGQDGGTVSVSNAVVVANHNMN